MCMVCTQLWRCVHVSSFSFCHGQVKDSDPFKSLVRVYLKNPRTTNYKFKNVRVCYARSFQTSALPVTFFFLPMKSFGAEQASQGSEMTGDHFRNAFWSISLVGALVGALVLSLGGVYHLGVFLKVFLGDTIDTIPQKKSKSKWWCKTAAIAWRNSSHVGSVWGWRSILQEWALKDAGNLVTSPVHRSKGCTNKLQQPAIGHFCYWCLT